MASYAGYTALDTSCEEEEGHTDVSCDSRYSKWEDNSRYPRKLEQLSLEATVEDKNRPEAKAQSPKCRRRGSTGNKHSRVLSKFVSHITRSPKTRRKLSYLSKHTSSEPLLKTPPSVASPLDQRFIDLETTETPLDLPFAKYQTRKDDLEHEIKSDTSADNSKDTQFETYQSVQRVLHLLTQLRNQLLHANVDELVLLNKIFNEDAVQLNEKVAHRVKASLHESQPVRFKMKEDPVQLQPTLFHCNTDKFHSLDKSEPIEMVKKSDEKRDVENNLNIERGQLLDLSSPPQLLKVSKESLTEKVEGSSAASQSDADFIDGRRSETTNSSSQPESPKVGTCLYKGEQVRVVTLCKDSEPLGATVRNEGKAIVVARIIEGGIAERTKLFKRGDEILQINGTDIQGLTVDEVAELMMSLTGDVRILTRTAKSAQFMNSQRHALSPKTTVRALFDYDAGVDLFIPCMELGLSFEIGDILHITNRDDLHWWQARREGEEDVNLAGLVPSRLFWETREQVRRSILEETDTNQKQKSQLLCCRPTLRRSRKKSATYEPSSVEFNPILTYEEVGLYLQEPQQKRPVVLVGCEELRLQRFCEKIAQLDKNNFTQPLTTTSRLAMVSPDSGKTTPLQYLPLDRFIEKIKMGEFVEYKVSDLPEMHYVGVNKKSVKEVIDSGRTCIMPCQPKNLSKIRTAEFKPYIVFVAAPSVQRLKTFLRTESTIEPTNEECKHIVDLSRHSESTYLHLYDYVMTVTSVEQACKEVMGVIDKLGKDSQWVPKDWLSTTDEPTPNPLGPSSNHSSSQSVASNTKHSVVADVEPEPSNAAIVTSHDEKRSTGEEIAEEVDLMVMDSPKGEVTGTDKWVELI